MKNIDLHIHTHHSDATLTVAEVAKRARRGHVTAGICDHLSPYHNLYGPEPFDAYVADVRKYPDLLLGAECCFGVNLPVGPERFRDLDYVMGAVHAVRLAGETYFFWGERMPEDLNSFMDAYVATAVAGIAALKPNVLAHPTFLPPPLQNRYDELWTRPRLEKLWAACRQGNVAVEISGRWLVPKTEPLRLAIEMGLTFSTGSDAHRAEQLFNLEYPAAMVTTYGIGDERIFEPRRLRG